MKLAELSQKPELIKIEIDKAELVEKYGDTLMVSQCYLWT